MLKGFEKEVTTLRFGKQRNKGEKNVVSGKNRCDNDDSRYLRKDVKKKKKRNRSERRKNCATVGKTGS